VSEKDFCPRCDAYFSTFLNATDRKTAADALTGYDAHRSEKHKPGRPKGSGMTRRCEASNTCLPTRTDHLRHRCAACGRRVVVKQGRIQLHYVSSVEVAR
jgi:ribosomal protein L44E